MTRPNAALALPPGDRDDAPRPPRQPSADLFDAGRDAAAAPAPNELLPGLVLVIDDLTATLEAAQIALADLKLARKHGQLALMKAAAHRLASLANHVNRTVKAAPQRETTNLQPTKE